jgi:protein-S-isoprenylcysteine O-methyltransferase Ste14
MSDPPPSERSPWWKGERGEWWVVGQGILMAALAAAPTSRPWPSMPRTPNAWLGAVLFVLGIAFAAWAVVTLGPSLTALPKPRRRAVLIDTGPYALVRHPIYGGVILVGLGWALWRGGALHLPLAFALAFYLNIKASREERFLMARFPDYHKYRERTRRRLVPWVA